MQEVILFGRNENFLPTAWEMKNEVKKQIDLFCFYLNNDNKL